MNEQKKEEKKKKKKKDTTSLPAASESSIPYCDTLTFGGRCSFYRDTRKRTESNSKRGEKRITREYIELFVVIFFRANRGNDSRNDFVNVHARHLERRQ